MPNGYNGKILRVNLSKGTTSVEEPDENFYRRYMGGWNFIAHYLLKELKPGTNPLGPANKLIFAPGVFTGAPISGSGRSAVGAKSPLTGAFGEADVGGFWAAELKRAGYDTVIVEGKAKKPSYIWINNGEVEIRDATHLWGKDTVETEGIIKDELDDKHVRIAQIGPAGENKVVVACVINDLHHSAGRTGMGAVMGSKNLKAIACRGKAKLKMADPDTIRSVMEWLRGEGAARYQGMQKNGTDGGLEGLSFSGGLPTRNFNLGDFEHAKAITGQTMTDTILTGRGTCYACVVRCKREVAVKEGHFKTDSIYGGPEYETCAAIGSNCGVGDLAAIAKGNAICNGMGLDTIGAGMLVSFAMECFENGLLTEKDTGGLKLNFGNGEAVVKLLEMIALRKGIGNLLAKGYSAAIAKIGTKAKKYAHEVKGQPLPMHEPRLKFGLGIGYAVSPTGADHVHNIHDTMFTAAGSLGSVKPFGVLDPLPSDDLSPEKIRLLIYFTNWSLMRNCIGLCLFLPYSPEQIRDMVHAVTGWNTSIWELMKVGERAMNMARAFNAREGFTAKDDYMPARFYEKFPSGPLKGVAHNKKVTQEAIKTYYDIAGWDRRLAAPTSAKLHELDVGWIADELQKYGKLPR